MNDIHSKLRDADRFRALVAGVVPGLAVADQTDVGVPADQVAARCDAYLANDLGCQLRAMIASLMNGSLGRKVTSWADVPLVDSAAVEAAFPVLARVQCVDVQEVYGRPWLPSAGPTAVSFAPECTAPAVFILEAGSQGNFLVNTEGANYARYICKLERGAKRPDASQPRLSGGAL